MSYRRTCISKWSYKLINLDGSDYISSEHIPESERVTNFMKSQQELLQEQFGGESLSPRINNDEVYKIIEWVLSNTPTRMHYSSFDFKSGMNAEKSNVKINVLSNDSNDSMNMDDITLFYVLKKMKKSFECGESVYFSTTAFNDFSDLAIANDILPDGVLHIESGYFKNNSHKSLLIPFDGNFFKTIQEITDMDVFKPDTNLIKDYTQKLQYAYRQWTLWNKHFNNENILEIFSQNFVEFMEKITNDSMEHEDKLLKFLQRLKDSGAQLKEFWDKYGKFNDMSHEKQNEMSNEICHEKVFTLFVESFYWIKIGISKIYMDKISISEENMNDIITDVLNDPKTDVLIDFVSQNTEKVLNSYAIRELYELFMHKCFDVVNKVMKLNFDLAMNKGVLLYE